MLNNNDCDHNDTEFFSGDHPGQIPELLILEQITTEYLTSLDPNDPPHRGFVQQQLLARLNARFADENKKRASNEKIAMRKTLNAYQVAQIMLRLHRVIRIAPNGKDTDRELDLLAMYVAEGDDEGLYTTSEGDILTVAERYNACLSIADCKEVLASLKRRAPRKYQCTHRDLVPVNNGVFNYSHNPLEIEIDGRTHRFGPKTLHSFHPGLVFLSKSRVNYNPDAKSPVIHNDKDGTDWEIEEWMRSLSDDDGVPELLWQIAGAIVRRYNRWNKSAWFYAERGNNGKGTLCEFYRNLAGRGSCTSIPLSETQKDFALEPLIRATAIIVDENDVGMFGEKAGAVKAIVTNDVIQINRKFRMPIAFQFYGFMVQCINDMPRFKDKSESFYRRQLFVPFRKSFTGVERRYIKDEYLQRDDVLEYALKRVLRMDYDELSEPQACRELLGDYKESNDPVRAWWNEFRTRFAWDLLPFAFLHAFYLAWFRETNPSGSPVSAQALTKDLLRIVHDDPDWTCEGKDKKVRVSNRMDQHEPLVTEYELTKWISERPGARRSKTTSELADAYRGIQRREASTGEDD